MSKEQEDLAKPASPEDTTRITHRVQLTRSHLFMGPLPPPDELIKYNEAIPNGAQQVFEMAKQNSAHRQYLEVKAFETDAKRSFFGLAAGFAVTISTLFVSAFLIYSGHDIAGASLFSASLAAIVIAFVRGSSLRQKEREAKLNFQQQLSRSE